MGMLRKILFVDEISIIAFSKLFNTAKWLVIIHN